MRKINNFARLNNHYLDWYEGKGPFLAVIGRPGIGKSWGYESLLKDEEYTLFKGRTTALKIFMDVQDHPDRRMVFDDVGSLFHDPACMELLKSLCDSRPQRTVHWNTNTRLLEGRAKEFSTSSSVLIVGNRTLLDHEDVRAILDRADAIEFEPTKQEILAQLRTFGEDEEIIEFLEKMPIIPSLRIYETARRWKQSTRINWQQELMDECAVADHIQTLITIVRNEPAGKQCEVYRAKTGRSRRDFYNHLPLAKELAACT
jgi:hypothetical protein